MGKKTPLTDQVKEVLEEKGFIVTLPDFTSTMNGKVLLSRIPITKFASDYDAVMLILNVGGFSQSNERRLHWNIPMGPDIPWSVTELPTYCISFNNPFHLIDVPMVPTYINAYGSDIWTIRKTVDKLMGTSKFQGVSPVDAFCGAWDTRI